MAHPIELGGEPVAGSRTLLRAVERDEFRINRRRALGFCLSVILSENRYTLFRIML
jgi:hypothetical protein